MPSRLSLGAGPLLVRASILLVLTAVIIPLVAVAPAEASTRHTAETRFVDSINAERAQRGLPRLVVRNDLRSVARTHSVRMADRSHLHHNPNLASDLGGTWRRLAENVGRGGSVASLHSAFMNSTGHRNNILDSKVTEVGVGVEIRSGTIWVTAIFRLPSSSRSASFSDVSSGSTHARDIARIADAGITMGCGGGKYCPNRAITRAEMGTFLARANALLPRNSSTFRDLGSVQVHAANVEAISRAKITNGCGTDRYCPGRAVTRAEMASFLARSASLDTSRTTTRFSDVPRGSTHAGAIEAIARAGITNGCGNGRYCPDRSVTRAEMASFLVRTFGL